MKKNDQNKNIYSSQIFSKTNLETNKFKTTDINILLNRVRLDKKKSFKKKLKLLFFIISIIFSLIIFLNN